MKKTKCVAVALAGAALVSLLTSCSMPGFGAKQKDSGAAKYYKPAYDCIASEQYDEASSILDEGVSRYGDNENFSKLYDLWSEKSGRKIADRTDPTEPSATQATTQATTAEPTTTQPTTAKPTATKPIIPMEKEIKRMFDSYIAFYEKWSLFPFCFVAMEPVQEYVLYKVTEKGINSYKDVEKLAMNYCTEEYAKRIVYVMFQYNYDWGYFVEENGGLYFYTGAVAAGFDTVQSVVTSIKNVTDTAICVKYQEVYVDEEDGSREYLDEYMIYLVYQNGKWVFDSPQKIS